MKELLQTIHQLAEYEEWLDDCPFPDGQPFLETAQRTLEPLQDKARELAKGTKYEEPVAKAIDGEDTWGNIDWTEDWDEIYWTE